MVFLWFSYDFELQPEVAHVYASSTPRLVVWKVQGVPRNALAPQTTRLDKWDEAPKNGEFPLEKMEVYTV